MVDNFKESVERKVWKTPNGARLLTVSGILKTGMYDVSYEKKDNGDVIIYCENIEDNS